MGFHPYKELVNRLYTSYEIEAKYKLEFKCFALLVKPYKISYQMRQKTRDNSEENNFLPNIIQYKFQN